MNDVTFRLNKSIGANEKRKKKYYVQIFAWKIPRVKFINKVKYTSRLIIINNNKLIN